MAEEPTNNQNIETNPQTNWYSGINEALLTDKIRSFDSIDAFAKSYNESQSFIGKGIPDENTPTEIRDAFYTKLGRPASPDKYDWTPPENISVDGANEENFKAFKQMCFDEGLTNKQVSAVMGRWSQVVENLMAEYQNKMVQLEKDSKATLSAPNEWGDKFDNKYNAVMGKLEELGVKDALAQAGVLNRVEVLKAFDSVISDSREGAIRGVNGKFVSIDDKIKQLQNHPAYFNSAHPEHNDVVRQINELFASKSK